jgi:hypothetical protein
MADDPAREAKKKVDREASNRSRQKFKDLGICTNCCREKTIGGKRFCETCLAKLRESRRARVRGGLCPCGREQAVGKACCEVCRLSMRASEKKRLRRRIDSGLCSRCGESVAPDRRLCPSCREKESADGMALRREVFAAYGGAVCVCCGIWEIEFLTLEHPDKDGTAHRRALVNQRNQGGRDFYRKLKALGFPQTPRVIVMCFNCNLARRLFGQCPCERRPGESSAEGPGPCHGQGVPGDDGGVGRGECRLVDEGVSPGARQGTE